GHSTNMIPNVIAITSSTSVERRRYQPAKTIATPASTHIHHGNQSVGAKCFTGFAFVSSGGRVTPLQKPARVLRIGLVMSRLIVPDSGNQLGTFIQLGTAQSFDVAVFGRGASFVYRMLCVYACCATSGRLHTAVNATATPPMLMASGHVRC